MQGEQFQLHAEIEERHWWFVARRRIMRRLVAEIVPPSPESIVVDVGCGTGANLAALADSYRCVGIDTSRQAVELARERFPDTRFLLGRAPEDLGEMAPQARLFLLMDVLEHVSDDRAMLAELLSAAAPGAYFLVTVPADASLWSAHDEAFGHYRRYDSGQFELLWSGLPVKPLLVSYFNRRLLPLIRAVRARNRRRGRAAGQAGTDFWLPWRPVNRMLEGVFAGESRRLVRVLRRRGGVGYPTGASLIAILQRRPGEIRTRDDADAAPTQASPVAVAGGAEPLRREGGSTMARNSEGPCSPVQGPS